MPDPIPIGGKILSVYDSPQRVPDSSQGRFDSLAYQSSKNITLDAHCLGKVTQYKIINFYGFLYDGFAQANQAPPQFDGLQKLVAYVTQQNIWGQMNWGDDWVIGTNLFLNTGDPHFTVPGPRGLGDPDTNSQQSLWYWFEDTGDGANTHAGTRLDGINVPSVKGSMVQILSPDAFNQKPYQLWRASTSAPGGGEPGTSGVLGTDLTQVSSGQLQPQVPFLIPLPYSASPLPNPNPPGFAAGPTDEAFWRGVGVTEFIVFP